MVQRFVWGLAFAVNVVAAVMAIFGVAAAGHAIAADGGLGGTSVGIIIGGTLLAGAAGMAIVATALAISVDRLLRG